MIIRQEDERTDVAIFHQLKQGESCSGDQYFVLPIHNGLIATLVDGLGSGEKAKESADAVIDVIQSHPSVDSEQLIRLCNIALQGKRGVVLGILRLDYEKGIYRFLSIGNIGLIVQDEIGKRTRHIPMQGYLASYYRPFKEEISPLHAGMTFLLFTDGVTDKELVDPMMKGHPVSTMLELYATIYGENRLDDTTIIGIDYK